MTKNSELKKEAIRNDYTQLFKEGVKKTQIIKRLMKKYYLGEQMIYRYLEVKTLRRERKLSHYKKVES